MNNSFSNAPEFVNQLKEIERLIESSDLENAVVTLNGLVKSAPRDPRLFLLGSRLAQASGNAEGVLKAATKAMQCAPKWPVATLHLAQVLTQRGDSEFGVAFAAMAVNQATQQKTLSVELLEAAAEIVFAFNFPERALVWLRQALELEPAHVGTRYKLGLALAKSGDLAGAIESYSSILLADRANAPVLNARLHAYLGAGKKDEALKDADALVALEPSNEVFAFYLSICRGEVPRTQPAALIAGLFDERAARFDQATVVRSKYKLPRDVALRIVEWYPERKADVLDLGCGTGLLGLALGAMEGVVVGVDLSAGMIEQAKRHGVYDKFHQVNVLDALHATPEGLYDVITALDVLPYVGALETAIPNAYRILQVGGRFVFSCEAQTTAAVAPESTSEQGYVLLPSYRFAHQRGYVQTLVNKAGFQNVVMEDVVLRQEAAGPVHGFVVTAQKPERSVRRSTKSAKPARRTG